MLGVIHRYSPFQSGNFMPKWVEVTEAGITYFKSAASDKAQGFFPKHVVKDVQLIAPPQNVSTLLSKLKNKEKEKRDEEALLMKNMFEVLIDIEALQVFLNEEEKKLKQAQSKLDATEGKKTQSKIASRPAETNLTPEKAKMSLSTYQLQTSSVH